MTIRRKLLLSLLAMTLTPLIAISGFHQASIWLTRQRLSGRVRSTLDASARLGLQQLLQSYDTIFDKQIRLTHSLLRRQAHEVEFRLYRDVTEALPVDIEEAYGLDESLDELEGPEHEVLATGVFAKGETPQISYRHQALFVPEGVSAGTLAADLARLRDMTAVYHEIHRGAVRGVLWQYASLDNGLHTSYPWTNVLLPPQSYDPRTRPWYVRAQADDDVVWVGPLVDAVTKETIITIATPVYRPDGSFAGVTAMDRTIPDILAGMKLSNSWAEGAERMLVMLDPQSDPCEPKVTVVLQASYADTDGDWERQIELENLRSRDIEQFRAMVDDIRVGRPNVRKMEHRRRPCLWAYGRSGLGDVVPLLIVPYEAVIELADSTSRMLLRESVLGLEVTGVVLLLAVAATVVLAAARAKALTRPIGDLVQAGTRLTAGDYDAHVSIATGDELEQLGTVFNETGPKLRERETLKRSLELAGAIQQSLLPREIPKLKHFDLAGQCRYCDETGGDYYDFVDPIDLAPGRTAVAVGDVSGHGIGAALLMAAARSSLRVNFRHHGIDLGLLFSEINRDLVRDTGADKFVTLFLGVLDDNSRSLTWAAGGHDPAVWYHAERDAIEELPNTGMLMGMFEEARFERAGPVHLKPGDVVAIGTDGIWESRDPEGNFFGKERFYEAIRRTSGSAEDICSAVMKKVGDFCRSAPRQDDITLVVLKAR
jgi:sigma-B regulation protein RsbU (phosphoserine phosphatase)